MHARRNISDRGEVRHRRTFGRTDLADAIEIRIVILPRQVLAHQAVGERHVFAAKLRGGSHQRVGNYSGSGDGQDAGRGFLVKVAE